MNHRETAGVAALGRILCRLSSGETPTVTTLVAEDKIARSTAFAVVRRMAEAGLVGKRASGQLTAGKAAAAYVYAAHHLGPLQGRAEPILGWLRDETNAGVELQAFDGANCQTLVRFSAHAGAEAKTGLTFPIHRDHREVARLRLYPTSAGLDADECQALAASVVERLEHLLRAEDVTE